MVKSAVMAIDVGTCTLKAAAYASGGRPLSLAAASVPYEPADPDMPLARSIASEPLWSAIIEVVRKALGAAGVHKDSVAAIGVTSQRQGIGALDASGDVLYLGPNMDIRAMFEGMAIDSDHADLAYSTTGHLPSFMMAPAKLRWYQLHQPEKYLRIATVVSVGDWVGYRLTGELALNETLAAEAGLLDVRTGAMATVLLETLGLRTDCFPQVLPPGVQLGRLSVHASTELGLAEGIPVVVAGADTQCGLLAMGVVSPGDTGVVAGWSVTSQVVTDGPELDTQRLTWVGRHMLPDRWTTEINAGDGGNAYQWLVELLAGTEESGFRRMEDLAAGAPAGSEGALALLGPAPLNPARTGLRPGGLLFPVPVTFGGVDRARLARAALENLAYAIRRSSALLSEVTGAPAGDMAVGGGMTRTALFPEVLASAMGHTVRVAATPDVSLQGAALAAEASLEGGGALEQLARATGDGLREVAPDPVDMRVYREHYARWQEAQSRLDGFL